MGQSILIIKLRRSLCGVKGIIKKFSGWFGVEIHRAHNDGVCQPCVRHTEVKVELEGAAEQLLGLGIGVLVEFIQVRQPKLVTVPGNQVFRGLVFCPVALELAKFGLDCRRNGFLNLLLDREDKFKVAVIPIKKCRVSCTGIGFVG